MLVPETQWNLNVLRACIVHSLISAKDQYSSRNSNCLLLILLFISNPSQGIIKRYDVTAKWTASCLFQRHTFSYGRQLFSFYLVMLLYNQQATIVSDSRLIYVIVSLLNLLWGLTNIARTISCNFFGELGVEGVK